MAAFSDYLEENLLEHLLNGTALATIDTVYIALYTSSPADDDSGAEVSGTNYARVAVDSSSSDQWGIADRGSGQWTARNLAAVTFLTAGGSWGTVTHLGVLDAATSGNLLFHAALAAGAAVNSGDDVEFVISGIEIELQ